MFRFSRITCCAAIAATIMGVLSFGSTNAGEPEQGTKAQKLRVLFAGNPTSERSVDFETLLKKHFTAVKVSNYQKFKPADADEFDVVIFDWTSIYPRDEDGKISWQKEASINTPQSPALTREFTRPAILIGAAGGTLCNSLDIAINWK